MDTPISLPPDLAEKATREAAERGMSLPELVRVSLERIVTSEPAADSLFADSAVFTDAGPANLASDHDKFLYGDAS